MMHIVYNEKVLRSKVAEAVAFDNEHPILVDKYVSGRECEVDAVCDGEDVFIPGIMEHIERTGVHSGDSMSVYPPYSLNEEVKKTITQDIDWNTEAEYTISQKLVRYLKYDDANTMVTIQINDGIKDNKLPIVNKSLVVEAPKLSDQLPSKVIVTGDGITYDYRDGKATISKVTPTDDDKTISWNNEDTYFVTYIYGVQGNISSLTSKIEGKANTITGELQGSVSEDIAIRSEVGTVIETSVSAQEEISKGYLITNTNGGEKISAVQHLVNKYKRSSSTISRDMQNAILHAWRVSSLEDLETYYTAKINYETGIPTPTEFIYYYADKIKKRI
jgi:hypothetical protein